MKRGPLAAAVLGLSLSGVLVWQSSHAVFSDVETNPGNSWTAGTVVLTHNKTGTALFDVSAMIPGASDVKCLKVDYDGTVEADVFLYGAYTDANADTVPDATELAPYLEVSVQQGTGSAEDCTDFVLGTNLYGSADFSTPLQTLATFVSDKGTYGTGVGSWTTNGVDDTRTFRIAYKLKDDNAAQGKATKVNFVWEAQSTTP